MTQKVSITASDIEPRKTFGIAWMDLQSRPTGGSLKIIKDGEWSEIAGGITDAPSDSKYYCRKDSNWIEIPSSIEDAPNDGNSYVRKNLSWNKLSSSNVEESLFSIKGNGDASGLLEIYVYAKAESKFKIDGGSMYVTPDGSDSPKTQIISSGGQSYFWIKCSNSAKMSIENATSIAIRNYGGVNEPTVYGYDIADGCIGLEIVNSDLSEVFHIPGKIELFFVLNSGNNITGKLNIPQTAKTVVVYGSELLSGQLTIPAGMTSLTVEGDNELTGSLHIPSKMISLSITGKNTLDGPLKIPELVESLRIDGENSLSGGIVVNQAMKYIYIGGKNTISGVLNLPNGVVNASFKGSNSLTYNFSSTPTTTSIIVLESPEFGNYEYNTTPGGFQFCSAMKKVSCVPKPGVWTSSMTDSLLIDLSAVESWIGVDKSITLGSNCGARTSESDLAVAQLLAKGVTINIL